MASVARRKRDRDHADREDRSPPREPPTRATAGTKALNVRRMEADLHRLASDVGVPLEPSLSSVTRRDDGVLAVVASASEFPPNDEERKLQRSALHAAILHGLQTEETGALDVRIVLPRPMDAVRRDARGYDTPASVAIRTQLHGVQNFVRHAYIQLFDYSLRKVVDAYPWRDADAMTAHAGQIFARTRDAMDGGRLGECIDTVLAGMVDELLPPLEAFHSAYDCDLVLNEASTRLGHPPRSRLELYDLVWKIGQAEAITHHSTIHLYNALFLAR